jgi:hypothetical protein
MEFLLGLATGYLLTWPGLIALLVLGTIFEANEAHSWATFTGIVSIAVAYFFFSIPLITLAYYAVGYFAVGFVWSFWRYKRHKDKIVEEYKDQSESARRSALMYLDPRRMLSQLTTWVFIWPFSMVENVLGDIIKLVQTAITKFFKGIYTRIYLDAVKQLMPEVVEETSGT